MVEFTEYQGLGYLVDPESETKQVFIPSPPTMATVKINPRPGIIYVTGGKVVEGYEKLDALKTYAEENKTAIFCPSSTEAEEIAKTYEYIQKSGKVLNVKRDELAVMGDADSMEIAQEAVDYLVDECDADIDDAEEFEF
ncbi:hypothetical protein NE683_08375 [Bariatricus massiliensis]|uniref:Uncharacterized protein n=1 Tax=Bariatricus massiliensis TaxID=1745713 RepID=A0ABS8DK65_9FIRM|nr:hypothetical protein [Bariatricus massiliensis]MCB7305567.1 hypothetical protein [Bariatricus massiliensis]MCB7376121.1 hypothetical protein [Bariatricus massiliensis]MCB7388765.1 hypothetical protein [Bariatricus massiliensis]MCB7412938.1 hypothetical protein [Bariatricus massiliensis]MCQ5253244.1 hypothetical protein [Bariatricus massiliensis]